MIILIFDPKGIELSGGERQKLALARALYKNTPVVILDEPTASLAPYAEYEIYKHINELTADKTAVFISHRLSSCRFCDRIIASFTSQAIRFHTAETAQGLIFKNDRKSL